MRFLAVPDQKEGGGVVPNLDEQNDCHDLVGIRSVCSQSYGKWNGGISTCFGYHYEFRASVAQSGPPRGCCRLAVRGNCSSRPIQGFLPLSHRGSMSEQCTVSGVQRNHFKDGNLNLTATQEENTGLPLVRA